MHCCKHWTIVAITSRNASRACVLVGTMVGTSLMLSMEACTSICTTICGELRFRNGIRTFRAKEGFLPDSRFLLNSVPVLHCRFATRCGARLHINNTSRRTPGLVALHPRAWGNSDKNALLKGGGVYEMGICGCVAKQQEVQCADIIIFFFKTTWS